MNIFLQVVLCTYALIYVGVELLGHRVDYV